MLGEEHSLAHDFPDYEELIAELIQSDERFAKDNHYYQSLDKQIRVLELNKSPIDDLEMHKLKHERSELKDSLYQRLIAVKKH
ncbi:YdcH family protein [uncultured Amphritea sp.]|uniref:YdcH family protein n=1 Tax=Amphritea sp. TaxID=1872502 RepID=UPI0025FFED1E|nr:YdcH family protein [uncultured Amphritea sp.]